MSDNTNSNQDDYTKLAKLAELPAKLKFKFIGNNNDKLLPQVSKFFLEEMNLVDAKCSAGNLSKTGKYLTININVTVENEQVMHDIYTKGAKLSEIVRVL
ncbi:MAG: DUF493 family protein [Ruminobacter sp.]|jgi:putative lipoic acid-binding regulatory protein|nr:DUF493 family protein [Ruminobacter sp.]